MDPEEEKALRDIEKYGCHIIHVMGDGDLPPFSYSVGIQKSCGSPESVVIGLKQPIAHFILNEYSRRVHEGGAFEYERFHSGFIEGFDCLLIKVDEAHYRDYFGWNLWLYKGAQFEIAQLIYPTTEGIWPWAPDASETFQKWQPLLTKNGRLDRSILA